MSPELLESLAKFGVPAVLLVYVVHRIVGPMARTLEAVSERLELLTLTIANERGLDLEALRRNASERKAAS